MDSIFKNIIKSFSILSLVFIISCSDDDAVTPEIEVPATYSFSRSGESTVAFEGQTTRILMAEELIAGLLDFDKTETTLLEMYANETADGGDANPFSTNDLNESTKSIRSKVAASLDYFSANVTDATAIKNSFVDDISMQVAEVFPAQNSLAMPGVPGQIADASSTRYINAKGVEYNELVIKGLIGALMTDQMLNNYLSSSVLDKGNNRADNDAGILVNGEVFTAMEHKWDEAYGYLYGTAANPANPNVTIGSDDSFLNKYLGRVNNDEDFMGIAEDIFNAFKLGRAAIVAGDYELRDEQAQIIQEKISSIIAVRAVYYMKVGKEALANNNIGTGFHDISEGLGFIFSLQFTRQPNSNNPYFTNTEVNTFISQIMGDGPNGLWDVKAATLDEIAETIAAKFDFTVEQS